MRKVYLALLPMFLSGMPVWAGSVVAVDTLDPSTIGGYTVDGSNTLAVAWTQTLGTTGNIRVNFQTGLFDTGGTFQAYLTNSFGTGTTSANEVAAPATFTLPDPSVAGATFGPDWIDLFDQVNLGVGFYYLTIAAEPGSSGAWSNTSDPTVTVAPGFFLGDLVTGSQFYASGTDLATYLPASNFSPISTVADGGGPDLMFDVSVPEPSTAWLSLGGALSLALLRRRRSA